MAASAPLSESTSRITHFWNTENVHDSFTFWVNTMNSRLRPFSANLYSIGDQFRWLLRWRWHFFLLNRTWFRFLYFFSVTINYCISIVEFQKSILEQMDVFVIRWLLYMRLPKQRLSEDYLNSCFCRWKQNRYMTYSYNILIFFSNFWKSEIFIWLIFGFLPESWDS